MGAWGIAISSNDTYADIYGEFFDLYDDGLDTSEISAKLIEKNQDTINEPADANNFWFALAKAQWECKQLDPDILKRVEQIIESAVDIEVWRELGASERDIRKRETVLRSFLEKLGTEKQKARTRKKKIVRQPVFEKGDCLAFQLDNGNFGGAIVLEAKAMVGFGLNLVATTRINRSSIPTVEDFIESEVLILNYAEWKDELFFGWQYSTTFPKAKTLFERVGKINISSEFEPDDYSAGYYYGGDWKGSIIDVANLQFTSEVEKPKPKNRIPIKRFMKSPSWKFW